MEVLNYNTSRSPINNSISKWVWVERTHLPHRIIPIIKCNQKKKTETNSETNTSVTEVADDTYE